MGEPNAAAHKMDDIYRYQRYIYDATRRHYLLGRDRLIADLHIPENGYALEIGCGTARNLILAARRYPTVRFCGIDVSEAMLQTARTHVAKAALSERIALAAGDATAFDVNSVFGRATFDRVFISYALSMIPAWQDVISEAINCTSEDGEVHIVDFGDFSNYPLLFQRVQRAWLRRFSVKPIPDFETEIAMLCERTGFTVSSKRLYGGYAIAVCLRRK